MFTRILSAAVLCLTMTACSDALERAFSQIDAPPSPAKIEQCPKVLTERVTADSDSRAGYQAATSAFLATYGGSLYGIRRMESKEANKCAA